MNLKAMGVKLKFLEVKLCVLVVYESYDDRGVNEK